MSDTYTPRKPGNYILLDKRRKHAMRHRVMYAVKTGKLIKLPCEFGDCTDPKVEAHHPDYSMPLEVLWLCREHHLELHRHLSPVLA